MEPEIAEFLKRIAKSISLGLLWMLINTTAGIMYGYGFIEGSIKWSNVLFYIWLLASFVAVFLLIRRIWKYPIKFEE